MRGWLPRVAVVLLLLAGTITVVWSGLNWPPPLWIIEYGLPGEQWPTGRVAVLAGHRFVEVPAGYWRVLDEVADLRRNTLHHRLCISLIGGPGCVLVVGGRTGGRPIPFATRRSWQRVSGPVWVSHHREGSPTREEIGRLLGVPVRRATCAEAVASSSDWAGEVPVGQVELYTTRIDAETSFLSLTLRADQEHLIKPYLVEDE